eukprot:3030822-Rhodomonas_salina.3
MEEEGKMREGGVRSEVRALGGRGGGGGSESSERGRMGPKWRARETDTAEEHHDALYFRSNTTCHSLEIVTGCGQ